VTHSTSYHQLSLARVVTQHLSFSTHIYRTSLKLLASHRMATSIQAGFLSLRSCQYWSSTIPYRALTISHVCKVNTLIYQLLTFCSVTQPFIWRSHFSGPRQKYGTVYLFTSANPKHTLLSDVILRRTTFSHSFLSPSGPCNAP